MATLMVDTEGLVVRFPRWEAVMVRRDSYAVARSSITHVRVMPGWTSEILGFRSGLVVSGFLKVGVWTHPSGTRRLVSMKRGDPTLRIGLARSAGGPEFDEILVTTPDAYALADDLESARAA